MPVAGRLATLRSNTTTVLENTYFTFFKKFKDFKKRYFLHFFRNDVKKL